MTIRHSFDFDFDKPDFERITLKPGFEQPTFRDILIALTDKDVSDIHIETNMPIWIRRFGAQQRLTDRAMTSHELSRVVSWLYQSSNAMGELAKVHDINKKYSAISDDGSVYSYRLNAVNSEQTLGPAVRIALRPIPLELPKLEDQQDLDPAIREAFIHGRGIGFVVGETGNGKSTLLAALNRDLLLNAPNRKLLTWEDPIEFDLFQLNDLTQSSHVSQHEIGSSVKTFYDGIVNSLRSAPTNILVGESKDRLTLDATLHSGETGHNTNTTLHAGSVRDSFLRIASEYPPSEQSGVIYKTLVNVNFVLVQKLLERPGGGRRYPLREWFVFDDETRRELLGMEDIKTALTRLDQMVRDKGQDFYTQSRKAFAAGKITAEAAKVFDIEMRQKTEIARRSSKLSTVDSFALDESVNESTGSAMATGTNFLANNIETSDQHQRGIENAELIRAITNGFEIIANQLGATINRLVQPPSRSEGGPERFAGSNSGHDGRSSNQDADGRGQHDQHHDFGISEPTQRRQQSHNAIDTAVPVIESIQSRSDQGSIPSDPSVARADCSTSAITAKSGESREDRGGAVPTPECNQSNHGGPQQHKNPADQTQPVQRPHDKSSTEADISKRRTSWNERFTRRFEQAQSDQLQFLNQQRKDYVE